VAPEASRRIDAADENNSCLTRFRGRRRWGILLSFYIEVSVIVSASIVKSGGAELVAQKTQGAEKEYCYRLFHVGIS
jgi:hypothetical protein